MKINSKFYYLIPIFTAAGIFFLSSIPQKSLPDMPFEFGDKIGHFIGYFIFGCTIHFSLVMATENVSKKKILLYTFLIGAAYAASDEFHQSFVQGRSSDVFDWLADVIGIALSLPMHNLFNKIKSKLNEKLSR